MLVKMNENEEVLVNSNERGSESIHSYITELLSKKRKKTSLEFLFIEIYMTCFHFPSTLR